MLLKLFYYLIAAPLLFLLRAFFWPFKMLLRFLRWIFRKMGEQRRFRRMDFDRMDGWEFEEYVAELLATTYHELREGVSSMGHRIDRPAAVMSTAEAVSVYFQTMMTAYYYGDSHMDIRCLVLVNLLRL